MMMHTKTSVSWQLFFILTCDANSARNTGANSQRRKRQCMRRSWRQASFLKIKRLSTQAGILHSLLSKAMPMVSILILCQIEPSYILYFTLYKCLWLHLFFLSVRQPFKGDYLEISKNPKYQKLSSAVDEKILLADVVNKINRANGKVGKKCFWKSIFTISTL